MVAESSTADSVPDPVVGPEAVAEPDGGVADEVVSSGGVPDLGAGEGMLDEPRLGSGGVSDGGGEGVSGPGGAADPRFGQPRELVVVCPAGQVTVCAADPRFGQPTELVGYPGVPGAVVGVGAGPLRSEHSPWEALMGEGH